jgi:uncharacterized membrane protein YphA (DoxX/SURF4 family)
MSTLSTILAAVLGIAFIGAGVPKLTGLPAIVENFERWGYPRELRLATGSVELLAGVFLIIGIAVPSLAIAGSMITICVMLAALVTHQRVSDPLSKWIPALTLLALDILLAISMLPSS